MTPIQTPAHLPDLFLNMHTVANEAEAVTIAAGRPAWIRTDALGVVYLYVESERK